MENNEYQALFLSESDEILASLNQVLIQLEKKPNEVTYFDEIFRHCHTLKGMAATMGYARIVVVSHAMENVLDRVRKHKIRFETDMIPLLFEGLDTLQALVEHVKSEQTEVDETPLVAQLDRWAQASTTDLVAESSLPETSSCLETPAALENPTVLEAPLPLASGVEQGSINRPSSVLSVRVNLERIESLMNTVGELHINKIRLLELAKILQDDALQEAVIEMERIATKLQNETMQIRLLPLSYLLHYFPRMVRDAAHQEGKKVNLHMRNADIGVDRAILDEMNDPLIHLLQNAVSHGIESPEDRIKQGKSAEGLIQIAARREQNVVVMDIRDDGRGLDPQKIRAALVDQNLCTKEEVAKLTDEEIVQHITLPGFSLSKEVTERAGRGVGMNVVRRKVEGIGGSLSIQSQIGKGTTFTLRLPISMAIIHAVFIQCANETCAIPLHNIIETIKIDENLIKKVEQQEVIPYKDEVLPLVRVNDRLGFPSLRRDAANKEKKLSIVVCAIARKKVGLVVEKLYKQQEIIIKNLDGALCRIPEFSGATILGTGRVAMILDVGSLIKATAW